MTTALQLDVLIDDLTVDAHDDDEQLSGFLAGVEESLRRGDPAWVVGVEVEVMAVDSGPDARTGLIARVRRDGALYEVALADLTFAPGSEVEPLVAAYRRWQGRTPLAERGKASGA